MLQIPRNSQRGCVLDRQSKFSVTSWQHSRSRSRFGRGPLKYSSALEVTRYVLGKAREKASFRRLALRAAGRSRVPVAPGPPDSPSGRIGASERELSSSFWLLSMEYDTSEDIRRLKGTGGRKRHKHDEGARLAPRPWRRVYRITRSPRHSTSAPLLALPLTPPDDDNSSLFPQRRIVHLGQLLQPRNPCFGR